MHQLRVAHIKYPLIASLGLFAGMIREIVVANEFGISKELDAYAAIFGFYLFFGVQLANTVESVFIARYAHLTDSQLLEKFFSTQFSLVIIQVLLCICLFLIAEFFVGWMFGFENEQLNLSRNIIRCFIPAMFFASLIGACRGVLNIKGNYAPGFFYGTVVSFSVIVSLLLTAKFFGILAIPLGYIVGNAIALVFGLWALFFKAIKKQHWKTKGIVQPFAIWSAASWILCSEILFQLSYTTERSFASKIHVGAVSTYFYAISILMVFSALVIQPVATLLFPIIARKYRKDKSVARRFVLRVCCLMLLVGLSFSTLMHFLSLPLIELLLVRGQFTQQDAERTAEILRILVFVLPFMSVNRILKNSLYARGTYTAPVIANGVRWISLLVIGFTLVGRYGLSGLSMAYVISSTLVPVCMFAFFIFDRKQNLPLCRS